MKANRNRTRKDTAKRLLEPEVQWRYVPRLAPGAYPAYCRAAKTYRDPVFKRWVCAAQFDVLSESQETLGRLTWFLNLGSADKPQVTRRRKYWAAWVKANGRPPQRRDRMSAHVFKNRYATVVVADTTRDSRQDLETKDLAYSVIRDVLSWDTGGPEQRGAESLSQKWIHKEGFRQESVTDET